MDNTDTEVLPPPAAPQQAPRQLLRRSSSDRVVAGVCGGLGRRYGIDPSALRVMFVVAVLAAGLGLLVYAALWLLLPDDRQPESGTLTRSLWRLVLGSLLAAAAALTLLTWLTSLAGLSGVVVGGFLVGLVVWLYTRRGRGPQPAPPGPEEHAVPPVGFAHGGTGGYEWPPVPVQPPAPPAPVDRSYLGLIVLLAAMMTGSLLTAAAAAGLVPAGPVAVLAAVLAVIAIGLVVSAFRGRARWLVVPALLVALALPPAALFEEHASEIGQAATTGIGERQWQPLAPGGDFRLGIGSATLDLAEWARHPVADAPVPGDSIAASVGLGELVVEVPSTWQVDLTATADIGEIVIDDRPVRPDGAGAAAVDTLKPDGTPAGHLELILTVDTGLIDIRRVEVPPAAPDSGRSGLQGGTGQGKTTDTDKKTTKDKQSTKDKGSNR